MVQAAPSLTDNEVTRRIREAAANAYHSKQVPRSAQILLAMYAPASLAGGMWQYEEDKPAEGGVTTYVVLYAGVQVAVVRISVKDWRLVEICEYAALKDDKRLYDILCSNEPIPDRTVEKMHRFGDIDPDDFDDW